MTGGDGLGGELEVDLVLYEFCLHSCFFFFLKIQ